LRAARANLLFCTDEKRIRTEKKVMNKGNNGLGLFLSKIADCARMCFSSARNRRSARTGSRPRNIATLQPYGSANQFVTQNGMTCLRQIETWAKPARALQSLPRER
jgi:hypothetical protein